MAVDTANKNIGRVAAMFREICDEKKLKLEDLFARSHIKGGEDKQRAPFDPQYVQDVLLADGVMDGLNDEARAIFYVVAETGMRPSEVAGLTRTTICLEHEVPHVKLTEEGRTLKNKNSRRTMPLVGVALEVMKHFPDGFPGYRNRTASLSTTINQYLRKNGLCPKEGSPFTRCGTRSRIGCGRGSRPGVARRPHGSCDGQGALRRRSPVAAEARGAAQDGLHTAAPVFCRRRWARRRGSSFRACSTAASSRRKVVA